MFCIHITVEGVGSNWGLGGVVIVFSINRSLFFFKQTLFFYSYFLFLFLSSPFYERVTAFRFKSRHSCV